MMLEFLGWKPEAAALRDTVRAALHENFVTPDLGGDKRTKDVGDWVATRAAKIASRRS
jgi:isocitrate/isopropylmalate dehydrogenase